MRVVICAMVVALLPCRSLFQDTQPPLSFEVISIKPTPVERQNRLTLDFCQSSGRFVVAGAPVLWSIGYAYRLKDYQMSGAPEWVSQFDSTYDIEGKPSQAVNNGQCRLMVQSLFKERFKLRVHRENKESPVYNLTIAKNGTKLRVGGAVKLNGGVQVDASGKADWPDGLTMGALATILSNYTDRPVVDRTGLTEKYGITLDFSLRDGDDRPSIFTAVQDQLGLKLEAGRAPIEMLVIDHLEKPEEN
jgi:uncharacterized protein (TIGR03435 family)